MPEQAARVAAAAGVRTLVLTHFLPLAKPEPTLACARREFDGEILFGHPHRNSRPSEDGGTAVDLGVTNIR